ncbi:MAG: acyl-CoA thioesterase [Solirubrobacterales bacterium]|nr:acyl-CoA thioesterase [Solirubrobacterales bacterium]
MYKSASTALRVRYNECDPLGVVFNANFMIYADLAVTELWREHLGGYEAMMEEGLDLAVVEANLRYFKPLRFDEEFVAEVRVEKIGNKSMTTAWKLTRAKDAVAAGTFAYVCVTSDTAESRPIPDSIRAALTV